MAFVRPLTLSLSQSSSSSHRYPFALKSPGYGHLKLEDFVTSELTTQFRANLNLKIRDGLADKVEMANISCAMLIALITLRCPISKGIGKRNLVRIFTSYSSSLNVRDMCCRNGRTS